MVFVDKINKKNIIMNSKSADRWALIEEMVDLAVRNKEIPNSVKDTVLNALIEREKSMTTGIGNGIAIPHCITDAVNETVYVLGLSRKGINFDSIDNLPVKVSILIVVPRSKRSQHIKTLANIAKIMNNEELRDNLLAMKKPEEIIEEIAKHEK